MLWKVYEPLARTVYLAYALVSVSYHWNNFLWPLIITNSVESRPLTVGLQVFSSGDQGIDWSIITAATQTTVFTSPTAGTAPLPVLMLDHFDVNNVLQDESQQRDLVATYQFLEAGRRPRLCATRQFFVISAQSKPPCIVVAAPARMRN